MKKGAGFTIVELLVVIVIIGILVTITIVSYTGIQSRAIVASLQSDMANNSQQLKIFQVDNSAYPSDVTDCPSPATGNACLKSSANTIYRYSVKNNANPQTFCLVAVNNLKFYMVTENSSPVSGSCFNVALGATAPCSLLVDEIITTSPWCSPGTGTGLQSLTVTLSAPQDISSVKVWHYYGDSRSYYGTKTEVSEDGTNWTTIFDSASAGIYQETVAGKVLSFSPRRVRYIRDWLNGSTQNTGNHWIEIQAF